MKINIDFLRDGYDCSNIQSLNIEKEGKLLKSVTGLFSNLYCCDVGNQELVVFERGEMVGNGVYKRVYLLESLSDKAKFALAKIVKRNINFSPEKWKSTCEYAIKRDYKVSTFLRENDVPYILQIFHLACDTKLYNVMEYCDQGTLSDQFFTQLPMKSRIELVLQLFKAVAGMHKNKTTHLDLKAANILVKSVGDKNEIRLADFGATENLNNRCLELPSSYPAPEMEKNYQLKLDTPNSTALDLWALGDILYRARFGEPILGKFKLRGSNVQRESDLRDSLNKNSEEIECFFQDTEKLKQLQEERKKHQAALDQMARDGEIYSTNLPLFLAAINKKFAESTDACERCILRLFSLEPEERFSAHVVVVTLTEWLSIQK